MQQMLVGLGAKPLAIGDFTEGGYFGGYISQNANGVATHGLIVAPAASGYNSQNTLKWKNSSDSTYGTQSSYDGAANTASMASDGQHPAASYCNGLTINGYSDWYLPARFELEIIYRNLKPTTGSNSTSKGSNSYAVPATSNYSSNNPGQTAVALFQSGGSEAFNTGFHWLSTEEDSLRGATLSFSNGNQQDDFKNSAQGNLVRAIRKFSV